MADVRQVWADRIRTERKARGWDKPEMARRLAHAAGDARSTLPDHESLLSYVKRWERAAVGISERYRLLYARAFGTPEEILFEGQDGAQPPPPWRLPGIDLDDAFTSDDGERLTLAARRPSRVDSGVVDALATVLAGQRRLEDAIGPVALLGPVTAQMNTITAMLRDASGPYRDPLGSVVAEWTCFAGWLHAAVRRDAQALTLLGRAEELADDASDGTIAAVSTSFRGYVARQQGRHRAVIRASSAALATPGVHVTQKTFDTLQAAQGYASLGEREDARRLLDTAADLAGDAVDPPPAIYWYSEPFFWLNIGIVHLGIGEYRDAADMLGAGLDELPADQRGAEWVREYQEAFSDAKDHS